MAGIGARAVGNRTGHCNGRQQGQTATGMNQRDLILGRQSRGGIDDKHSSGTLLRLKPEPKLVLQGTEYRRSENKVRRVCGRGRGISICSRRKLGGSHFILHPIKGDIVSAFEAGGVGYRSAEFDGKHPGQSLYLGIRVLPTRPTVDHQLVGATERYHGKSGLIQGRRARRSFLTRDIGACCLQLRPTLRDQQLEYRHVFHCSMDFELEAVRQQILEHGRDLLLSSALRNLRDNVKQRGVEPVGAGQFERLNAIRLSDQPGEGHIRKCHAPRVAASRATPYSDMKGPPVRRQSWLDGNDLKPGRIVGGLSVCRKEGTGDNRCGAAKHYLLLYE